MMIINFSHPLTGEQQNQIEGLTGRSITDIRNIPCQFDHERPFAEQLTALVETVGLTSAEWQSEQILVNAPSFAPAVATLIAELHGRMGYFPAIIRLKPVPGSTPPRFEFAEIINLQAIRDHARTHR